MQHDKRVGASEAPPEPPTLEELFIMFAIVVEINRQAQTEAAHVIARLEQVIRSKESIIEDRDFAISEYDALQTRFDEVIDERNARVSELENEVASLQMKVAELRAAVRVSPEDVAKLRNDLDIARALLQASKEARDRLSAHPLTNLPNLKTALPHLNRLAYGMDHGSEADRRHNERLVLTIGYLDIDDFKSRINDGLGHPIGDEVIAQTGEYLQRIIRAGDQVIHKSGDEFIIVLVNMTGEEAVRLFRSRLRFNATVHPLAPDGMTQTEIQLPITISAGFADRKPGEDVLLTITRADSLLVAAKAEAKGRGEKGLVLRSEDYTPNVPPVEHSEPS